MRGGGYFEEESVEKNRDIRLLMRFLPFVTRRKLLVTVSVFLVVVISVLDISMPLVTRMALDKYIVPILDAPGMGIAAKGGNMDLHDAGVRGAGWAGILLLIIAATRFLLSFVQVIVMEYTGQRIMHDLRMTIYDHIQRLAISFFDNNPVGRLATRVTNDVQNMQEMFTSIITFVMKDSFMLVGIVGVLLYMDLGLALAVFLIIPFVILASILFSGRSRKVFRVLRLKVAEINAMFSECIGGMKVIQLFTREKRVLEDFRRINHENYLAGLSQIKIYGLFMPVIDLMGSTALAIVIFYGGGRVTMGVLSLGTLVAFISYMKMFFRPIRDIAEKHNILQNALASGERIVQVLDREVQDSGGYLELSHIDSIEFKGVSMAYRPDEMVLDDISFSLKSGAALAIVGPTGSGKTSLISLLVSFYPDCGGKIMINGREIGDYSVDSVRSKIALVTQDPYLFSGTVRENIIPPGKELSKEELDRVISLSNLKGVIETLPGGMDCVISEGGGGLSSGERQLISIARAFAHRPDLIIFDEATSYVDTEAEEKIRVAVSNLKERRTSITIAHRLRSAVTADEILVLQKGRVKEIGNHGSLMEKQGLYYRMHRAETIHEDRSSVADRYYKSGTGV